MCHVGIFGNCSLPSTKECRVLLGARSLSMQASDAFRGVRESDGPPVNGHAEGTKGTRAFLTCGNALPEKWKVGGSTPPLPTTQSRRSDAVWPAALLRRQPTTRRRQPATSVCRASRVQQRTGHSQCPSAACGYSRSLKRHTVSNPKVEKVTPRPGPIPRSPVAVSRSSWPGRAATPDISHLENTHSTQPAGRAVRAQPADPISAPFTGSADDSALCLDPKVVSEPQACAVRWRRA